jgi:hypothetical protein
LRVRPTEFRHPGIAALLHNEGRTNLRMHRFVGADDIRILDVLVPLVGADVVTILPDALGA